MPKRILQGVVVSDKQEKTLVVRVERRFTHPLFKKTVRKQRTTTPMRNQRLSSSATRSPSRRPGRFEAEAMEGAEAKRHR